MQNLDLEKAAKKLARESKTEEFQAVKEWLANADSKHRLITSYNGFHNIDLKSRLRRTNDTERLAFWFLMIGWVCGVFLILLKTYSTQLDLHWAILQANSRYALPVVPMMLSASIPAALTYLVGAVFEYRILTFAKVVVNVADILDYQILEDFLRVADSRGVISMASYELFLQLRNLRTEKTGDEGTRRKMEIRARFTRSQFAELGLTIRSYKQAVSDEEAEE